jgi:hypothetical protein
MSCVNFDLKKCTFVILLAVYIFFCSLVSAEPNKFGIHIAVATEEDIARASDLVNGDRGAYGYITVVIQEDKRDVVFWQSVFDNLRRKRLIPIVRIATSPDGATWREPSPEDSAEWVSFFQKLNWVTKERYIILFNEPNHANEWGGVVNPISYGRVSSSFARDLKRVSDDYKIMLAGMDLSAPESRPRFADAHLYLQESIVEFCKQLDLSQLNCADHIDAIASHSYPNPGFVGSPYDTGRKSIQGYRYEIEWFRQMFGKRYPVYITETGWDSQILDDATVASYFEYAFKHVWLPDEDIKAVTPFILNYQGDPFLGFSLLEFGSVHPKKQYLTISSLPKHSGEPQVVDKMEIQADMSKDFVEDSKVYVDIKITNTGQAIWGTVKDVYPKYEIVLTSRPDIIKGSTTLKQQVEPKNSTTIKLLTTTSLISEETPGVITIKMLEKSKNKVIGQVNKTFILHSRPSLVVKPNLFLKNDNEGKDYELQIFDADERLVYKHKNLVVKNGLAKIDKLSGIIPGQSYRFVILKPRYLPRQIVDFVQNGENFLSFEPMLPLDTDQDGGLGFGDLSGLIFNQSKNKKEFAIFEMLKLYWPIN